MPTYQYRCQTCGNDLEAFQKFTDDPLTDCPDCGGNLRKIFSPVGIVFKGSGFYATDSRKSTNAAAPATGTSSDTPDAKPTTRTKTADAASSSSESKAGATSKTTGKDAAA